MKELARPERFELPTNWFEASYSIQLSYGRVEVRLYTLSRQVEGLIERDSHRLSNFYRRCPGED